MKFISVSAVALLIGVGAAVGQGGSARQTEHNVEKQKDSELLTPIRPLPRKVGETSWPDPKPDAQREANERKAAPARETTGQSISAQSNKPDQPNNAAANNQQPTAAAQPAPNNQAASQPAQTAQQPAATQDNAKAQPQPTPVNQAAQQPSQKNAPQPAPQPSQTTAQSAPAANSAQPNQQNAQPSANQNSPQQAQNNSQQDHASIRLGTDASGKVAINEDQEQELAKALRKARPAEVNVGVQIGNPPPQGVRLAAVSADVVRVLPQFRGYSYFATADQVYIVDPAAHRVVAMVPVKLTATVKREAPSRTTIGRAPAGVEANAAPAPAETVTTAPAQTATVTNAPEPRSTRSTRRGDDLAGIEAAIEREVQRKGLSARGGVVVIEDAPAVQRVPTRRWRPWFAGDVQ